MWAAPVVKEASMTSVAFYHHVLTLVTSIRLAHPLLLPKCLEVLQELFLLSPTSWVRWSRLAECGCLSTQSSRVSCRG